MKNKTWKNYLGAAALVTVLFAGSVSAYFTDQDEKVNTFTVGKVTIELEEPKWEKKPDDNGNKIPDEAERMKPNQTIIKDPQVKNELKTSILDLSKDLDTFVKEVEESDDPRYSPDSNSRLIVRLREADKRLQKARFLLVQRDALIDVPFWFQCDRLG